MEMKKLTLFVASESIDATNSVNFFMHCLIKI
jgi:hypothetical protein